MKLEKLMANNQPDNWLERITSECSREYPMGMVDIEPDELVLDIGANVGGFWNAWKWRFNNWHLVEPSTYNCEQIRANGYEGSYSRNAAGKVSGERLQLKKYMGNGDDDTNSGNFSVTGFVNETNKHGFRGDEYEEVIALSFNDITKGQDIGLLKIDCEGAEYDFLMGADLKGIKYIVMEMHNFLGEVKQKELMAWIERTHDEIYSDGNGNDSHYIKLWRRR